MTDTHSEAADDGPGSLTRSFNTEMIMSLIKSTEGTDQESVPSVSFLLITNVSCEASRQTLYDLHCYWRKLPPEICCIVIERLAHNLALFTYDNRDALQYIWTIRSRQTWKITRVHSCRYPFDSYLITLYYTIRNGNLGV